MLRRTWPRRFAHLVREVDTHGFVGDFRALQHVDAPATRARVAAALQVQSNVLFCGHYRTGKMTLLKALGQHCEQARQQRVAYVSADAFRASRLDGYLLHHFLGLRVSKDELPSQEQLEGTLERHVRLVESTYAECMPSLRSAEVLVLDALEKVPAVLLRSMDAVCRRLHGKPHEAFGGLRVFAAADFWSMPVHPGSDTGGYAYQLREWPQLFPRQVLLRDAFGQHKQLGALVRAAHDGALTSRDMQLLEATRASSSSLSSSSSSSGRRRGVAVQDDKDVAAGQPDNVDDGDNADEQVTDAQPSTRSSGMHGDSGGGVDTSVLFDEMVSSADALLRLTPRFPKQPALQQPPARFRQLKQGEMGSFLVNLLVQSCHTAAFGLVQRLSVDVGSRVHLLYDGQAQYGVPAGAVGEVRAVREHVITVYFPLQQRTVDVPRMRVTCYHASYPEVMCELRQFPLFPRAQLCPASMQTYPNTYYVHLDGRRMADTNDLGNLLARMRRLDDFTLRHGADFAHVDGMVHEPTRIYYHELAGQPMSSACEYWCRNCKAFVPTATFFEHWRHCVASLRWCGECSKTVPLELLEPHKEKHQVVMCIDCGRAVEWRHWEAHRISCVAMMREISPENAFLPLRTRQLALELGLDKRDLHTMHHITRGSLPKSRQQVR